MDRWLGQVAIVTGASGALGAAITKLLVENGMKVVGLARRTDRLQSLAASLKAATGQLHPLRCNITNEDSILRCFKWVQENLGPVHILINNAGLTRPTNLTDGASDDWRKVFEVNVIALCICTREAIRIMKQYSIAGHIIHMNSVLGHYVPNIANFNVYPASKFAVTALTESLRQELRANQSPIKVTSISPGLVKNEIDGALDNENFEGIPALKPEEVAEAVVFVLGTGPNVQVQELIMHPLGQLY